MKQFEIGKQYSMRSPCDRNCVWAYTVVARTDKTVTVISDLNEKKTLRINAKVSERNGVETVYPLGRYSMAPSLSA